MAWQANWSSQVADNVLPVGQVVMNPYSAMQYQGITTAQAMAPAQAIAPGQPMATTQAMTPAQQYAIQQNWQQWQTYQQQYAQWQAQYGEQYHRELQQKFGPVPPVLPIIPNPIQPLVNIPPPPPSQPTPPPPPPEPEQNILQNKVFSQPPPPPLESQIIQKHLQYNTTQQYRNNTCTTNYEYRQTNENFNTKNMSVYQQSDNQNSGYGDIDNRVYQTQQIDNTNRGFQNQLIGSHQQVENNPHLNNRNINNNRNQFNDTDCPPNRNNDEKTFSNTIIPGTLNNPSYSGNYFEGNQDKYLANRNNPQSMQIKPNIQNNTADYNDQSSDYNKIGVNREVNLNVKPPIIKYNTKVDGNVITDTSGKPIVTNVPPPSINKNITFINMEKGPEEIAFDEQFKKWEDEFSNWKRQNANHPDRKAYIDYEEKMEQCRTKLLERREQMRRRKLEKQGGLLESSKTSMQTYQNMQNIDVQSIHQKTINKPNVPFNSSANSDAPFISQPDTNNQFITKANINLQITTNSSRSEVGNLLNSTNNNCETSILDDAAIKQLDNFRDLSNSNATNLISEVNRQKSDNFFNSDDPNPANSKVEENQEEVDSFFNPAKTNCGIPGLDLIPSKDNEQSAYNTDEIVSECIDLDNAKNTKNRYSDTENNQSSFNMHSSKKRPDLEAISKGINNILGDPNLVSLLSNFKKPQFTRSEHSNDSTPMEFNNPKQDIDQRPQFNIQNIAMDNKKKIPSLLDLDTPFIGKLDKPEQFSNQNPWSTSQSSNENLSPWQNNSLLNKPDSSRISSSSSSQINMGSNQQNNPSVLPSKVLTKSLMDIWVENPWQHSNSSEGKKDSRDNFKNDFEGDMGSIHSQPDDYEDIHKHFSEMGEDDLESNRDNFDDGDKIQKDVFVRSNNNEIFNNSRKPPNDMFDDSQQSNSMFSNRQQSNNDIFNYRSQMNRDNFNENNVNRNQNNWNYEERNLDMPPNNNFNFQPFTKRDEFFQPVQVIDYQNQSSRTTEEVLLPMKVVDYGHKPSSTQNIYNTMKSIDYGHLSHKSDTVGSRKSIIEQDRFSNFQLKNEQNSNLSDRQYNTSNINETPSDSPPMYPSKWQLINDNRKRPSLPTKRGKKQKFMSASYTKSSSILTLNKKRPNIDLDEISSNEGSCEEFVDLTASNDAENTDSKIEFDCAIVRNTIACLSPIKRDPNTVCIDDILLNPGRKHRPQKMLIIMRGPPGSGKTHLAKLIKDKEVEMGGSAARILNIDDYFMTEIDEIKICPDTGKKIPTKKMLYEYEKDMEDVYMQYLIKSFKKTITDGLFDFVIVDCINASLRYYTEFYNFAKTYTFTPYTCEMEMNVDICAQRNIHNRTRREIQHYVNNWSKTPDHYIKIDYMPLLESAAAQSNKNEVTIDKQENSRVIDGFSKKC